MSIGRALSDLDSQRKALAGNLTAQGVPALPTETLHQMVAKVLLISGDGVKPIIATYTGGYFKDHLVNLSGVSVILNLSSASIANMFRDMAKMVAPPEFNTTGITNFSGLFYGCVSLGTLGFDWMDTSSATTMAEMFYDCNALVSPDFSWLNTANVTSMHSMFEHCDALNAPDLSAFNTAKVTNMQEMFYLCVALDNPILTSFDTSKVTTMAWMFRDCRDLATLDLSSFTFPLVSSFSYMFGGCSSLIEMTQIAVGRVADLSYMFSNCTSLKKVHMPITGIPSSTTGMFQNCPLLEDILLPGMAQSFSIENTSLSTAALDALVQSLATVTGKSLTVRGVLGATDMDQEAATAKGWSLVGIPYRTLVNLLPRTQIFVADPSLDLSRWEESGTIIFYKNSPYTGLILRMQTPMLKPNTPYQLGFKIRKLSGTILNLGGHTDSTWNNNTVFVDGVRQPNDWANNTTAVKNDGTWMDVVVSFITPSSVSASHDIYIQPNRGHSTEVISELSNVHLVEGDFILDPWIPHTSDVYTPAPVLGGTGRQDLAIASVTESGSTFSGFALDFAAKDSFWLAKISIRLAVQDTNVTINIRRPGGEILHSQSGLTINATDTVLDLSSPIYLRNTGHYVLEVLFSAPQKLLRRTSYLHNGALWTAHRNHVNTFEGTAYSENPAVGLIEYLTP